MNTIAAIACSMFIFPPPNPPESPSASTVERQVGNLLALANLHRLVRYHHPGRAAAEIDWDKRLVQAVPQILAAEDQATLATSLRQFVRDAGPPQISIEPVAEHTPPELFRTAPVVETHGNVLYAALSSGDCCKPTIEFIEEQASKQTFDSWVLDLRHTDTRGFGSVFTETKVTLAWTICGRITQPPRIGRKLPADAGEAGASRQAEFAVRPGLSAEGPDLLANVPLLILVDETTHPAVGGWVMAAQVSGRATVTGTPVPIQAELPYELSLTPGLQASMPLTVYAPPKNNKLTQGRLLPDIEVQIPTDATPADTLALLAGLAPVQSSASSQPCDPDSDPMSPDQFAINTAPVKIPSAAKPVTGKAEGKSNRALAETILRFAAPLDLDTDVVAPDNSPSEALRKALVEKLW
jgi:hypothetical protein